jgi:hypothetical protein
VQHCHTLPEWCLHSRSAGVREIDFAEVVWRSGVVLPVGWRAKRNQQQQHRQASVDLHCLLQFARRGARKRESYAGRHKAVKLAQQQQVPQATDLNASIWRSQLTSGFELAQIWFTSSNV